ncbi:MAG: hypothetical protein LBQ09_06365 [Acidobacteriaceae bacterium]|jgi:hypothetical protein|nr:hypothetical protein [Acidobacteriaceae bacterium]
MKCETVLSRIRFALVLLSLAAPLASAQSSAPKPMTMTFAFLGTEYVHQWSNGGQHEFTPHAQADLTSWEDMVTLNVYESTSTGEQLADVANTVLGSYQRLGKILRTDSTPRTADRAAEHLIVAVLGNPAFLEAAFARFALVDGAGMNVVYSHRVYGTSAGPAMSTWLESNGPQVERALMAWTPIPDPKALQQLPQRR